MSMIMSYFHSKRESDRGWLDTARTYMPTEKNPGATMDMQPVRKQRMARASE